MVVSYTAAFIRMFAKLPQILQEEALEKIEVFRDEAHHHQLKVHKLSGRLKDRWSFSVNYQIRIVFTFVNANPKEEQLHAIGDHDVYR